MMPKRRFRIQLSHLEIIERDGSTRRVSWTQVNQPATPALHRWFSRELREEQASHPTFHFPVSSAQGHRTVKKLQTRQFVRELTDGTHDRIWILASGWNTVAYSALASVMLVAMLAWAWVTSPGSDFARDVVRVCPAGLIGVYFGLMICAALTLVSFLWFPVVALRDYLRWALRSPRPVKLHTNSKGIHVFYKDRSRRYIEWRALRDVRRTGNEGFTFSLLFQDENIQQVRYFGWRTRLWSQFIEGVERCYLPKRANGASKSGLSKSGKALFVLVWVVGLILIVGQALTQVGIELPVWAAALIHTAICGGGMALIQFQDRIKCACARSERKSKRRRLMKGAKRASVRNFMRE